MSKKRNKRVLKYVTINKLGSAPVAGSRGNQPNTIYVKQVSDTSVTPLFTDNEGKAMGLEAPSAGASTFRALFENGNYLPGPISFLYQGEDATTNAGSPSGALGINPKTYTFYWGTDNPESTGVMNFHLGYNALCNNTTGQYNVAVGHYAMEKNREGSFNTIFGDFAGRELKKGGRNTFIGLNAGNKVLEANDLTLIGANAASNSLKNERFPLKDVTDICPVFGEYFNGLKNDIKVSKYGWDASTQSITNTGTYIGASAGDYGPSRVVGSFVATNHDLNGWVYRNYNNDIGGNFFKFSANTQIHNSFIRGSFLRFQGNIDNILALHYGKTEYTAVQNSLLYGKFDERKLKINGALTLNPSHAPAVNNTFTKVAVANDNGDLTFLTLGQLKGLLEGVSAEALPN